MSYREYPERLVSDNVRKVVGEDPQIDAAVRIWSESIKFRMIRNPQDAPVHLILEPSSQATASFLVRQDGVEELTLCLVYETDDHGTKRLSAARMTSA